MTKIAPGIYSIDSFSNDQQSYRVNLNHGTCTCPHYTKRLAGTGADCKHLTACRAERFSALVAKAKVLPVTELETLLPKYEERGDLEIAVAIRAEIQARRQHAAKQDELKALFA